MEEHAAIVKDRGASATPQVGSPAPDQNFVLNTELSQKTMVANFIEQLKEAETPAASKFRARRLSSAHTYEKSPFSKMPSADKNAGDTVIYSSTEMDRAHNLNPHFSPETLGSYSCHGIEPSDDDDGGIHQKTNQDRGCVVYPFNNSVEDTIFAVLDGHGEQGDLVSEYVMRQFVQILEKHSSLATDPVAALKDSLVKTNTSLMATSIKYMTSGCTCVCAYMQGNTLYVANVGDSRCVVGVDQGGGVMVAKDLSHDHKPDNPDEMARIIEWGGFVSAAPEPGLSARVWLDARHTMIGLAMSRSIGDFAVKSVGVIPEPEILVYQYDTSFKFMVLASDGVWEFLESQDVIDIVAKHISQGANTACKAVIEAATARWREEEGDYRDDVSTCLLCLIMSMPNCSALLAFRLPRLSSSSLCNFRTRNGRALV
jgi:serine/threonine protein phosphatase PrpC